MTDIVRRLRDRWSEFPESATKRDALDAADEIERLRAERDAAQHMADKHYRMWCEATGNT